MTGPGSWDARAPARERARRREERGGVPRRRHLLALCAFAIAQPLFAKLAPAPGYLAAHGLTSTEVVLLAFALVLVPPLLLWLVEAILGVLGRRVRWVVHLVLVAALVALIALPPLGSLPTTLAYIVAGLLGAGFAYAYARWRGVRSFTSVLALAPALFLAWFLLVSPTAAFVRGTQRDAWRASGSFRPPIVFVQLDSLSTLALETPGHRIDARRYPNLARLARDGVWYRNASSVAETSAASMPSFLDGRLPRRGAAPVVQDHSPNLFTTLGTDYRMNVAEEVTALCPPEFCLFHRADQGSIWKDTRVVFNQIVRPHDARAKLPPIDERWTDFAAGPPPTRFANRAKTRAEIVANIRSGRVARFEAWLAQIRGGGARPELDYAQVLLPRLPREFTADGHHYVPPEPGLEGPPVFDNRFLSDQAKQRALLQAGFADLLIGRLIARLEQVGVYDDAFVIVAADRGEQFSARRNLADLASIPLFVKYPQGQGKRGVDDRYVRAVDVYPTVAAALGFPLPRMSGHDLRGTSYKGHAEVRLATAGGAVVRMAVAPWQRARERSLQRRLRLFGSGAESLYRWGPQRALVGRSAPSGRAPDPLVHATVLNAKALAAVDAGAPQCQCQLAGRITGGVPAGMALAVAVNGRIAATGTGFAARGARKLNWTVMVPPRAFEDGRNTVQVFRVDPGGLTPLGGV